MKTKWIKTGLIVSIVTVLSLGILVYWAITAYPSEIIIATGPPGGQYRLLAETLTQEIQNTLQVKVSTKPTNGSLENLVLLAAGEVDFALYQTWSAEIINELDEKHLSEGDLDFDEIDVSDVRFVANMYSQPAHLIVRRDAGIETAADLAGKTINLGLRSSGDYAMSLVLLDHLGLTKATIESHTKEYESILT